MVKDLKIIFGILSTVLLIISGISIEINDVNDEPNAQTIPKGVYSHPSYRQHSYSLVRNSDRFVKRLRRATNLLMFKNEDNEHQKKANTEKVIKAVKTVSKGLQEMKSQIHNKDNDYNKLNKTNLKKKAKVVSIHFEIAYVNFVLSFTLPKLISDYLF